MSVRPGNRGSGCIFSYILAFFPLSHLCLFFCKVVHFLDSNYWAESMLSDVDSVCSLRVCTC